MPFEPRMTKMTRESRTKSRSRKIKKNQELATYVIWAGKPLANKKSLYMMFISDMFLWDGSFLYKILKSKNQESVNE